MSTAFAVQVFEGESVFYYPQNPAAEVEVPMLLKKDAAVDVSIKVCVAISSHSTKLDKPMRPAQWHQVPRVKRHTESVCI